jgi:uncharacterized protein YndB with AHSA1/START domain
MKTIHHLVTISTPPARVLEALTTIDGLAAWWTTAVDGDAGPGGVIDFTFNGGFGPDMKVENADGMLVAWTCVGGHEAWSNNTFRFELESTEGGQKTILRFWQQYTIELPDDAYGTYNYNWGYYLESLRVYCETGTGTPFDPERRDIT